MAPRIGYVDSSQAVFDPAAHAAAHPPAAFFANWDPAVDNDACDHDLLCAELSRLAYADEATVRDALRCPGFTTVDFVGGDGIKARVATLGTQGFVATNPASGLTVVAFRGTESGKIDDLVTDARASQRPWPESAARVHTGFLDCYMRVRLRVADLVATQSGGAAPAARRGTLLLTGHSLGGALATLAAIDLQPSAVVTFGSPLVGDAALGALLANVPVRRYVDCCDLVTRLPPERVDRENVTRLLSELADSARFGRRRRSLAGKAIRGVARGVDRLFADSGKAPDYAHLGTLYYIDRNGATSRAGGDERTRDQQIARDEFWQGRRDTSVALRDLADHAPINYVSALAGRLPTVPGYLHTAAEVAAAERVYLDQRRAAQGQPSLAEDPVVSGLCLSGGGIRSATFGLGILQALAKHRMLARFDYLSTVSGGGYIGSCLTSLLSRGRDHQNESWRGEVGLDPASFPLTGLGATEVDRPAAATRLHVRNQMHHLRTHSEFLMSHRGILSRDVLRAVGLLFGGIAYTLTVYLLLLGVAVTLLHLLVSTVDPLLAVLQPGEAVKVPPDLGTLDYVKTFLSGWWNERVREPLAAIARASSPAWSSTAFALGLAWAQGWLLWARRKTETLAKDDAVDFTTQRAGWSADDQREADVIWQFNRASTVFGVLLVGGAALAHTWTGRAATWYAGLAMPVAFALGGLVAILGSVALTETFSRHDDSRRDRRRRSVRAAMVGSAWFGLLAAAAAPLFLVTIAALGNLPFKLLQALVMLAGGYFLARRQTGKAGTFGALRIGARPLLTALTAAFLLLSVAGVSEALLRAYDASSVTANVAAFLAFLAVTAALTLVGYTIDANRISPHYFYRDRLTEAYLQTVAPVERGDGPGHAQPAQGKPVMLLRNDEDLLLRNAGVEEDQCRRRRQRGPYHLLVTALNMRGSDELNRRSFLSDHFIFSPGFVGSSITGFARTDEYESGQLRLSRPMAISAAAVGSGVGCETFWAQAFFATLFNARLGYWMENPWWQARHGTFGSRRGGLRFWPAYLLRELSGKSHARGRLINLSDGGHTGDNLGLVPLLERRCDFIMVADAEADAGRGFGSFMNAVRMAQVELDVEIEIDLGPIQRRKDQDEGYPLSEAAVAFGTIRYPAGRSGDGTGAPAKEGTLVYLKAAAARCGCGDKGPPLPAHVTAYLRENPNFPHQSTMDQFFDDAQFESYRALGVHVAEAAAVAMAERAAAAAAKAAEPAAAKPGEEPLRVEPPIAS
jgi:lipase (class 3)/patatin-like phospholipase